MTGNNNFPPPNAAEQRAYPPPNVSDQMPVGQPAHMQPPIGQQPMSQSMSAQPPVQQSVSVQPPVSSGQSVPEQQPYPEGVQKQNPVGEFVDQVVQAAGPQTIDTSRGKKDGLNKCPKCGSADIFYDPATGSLTCTFCRTVFKPEAPMEFTEPSKLKGEHIGSGSKDVTDDSQVTIKCQGCGAEVVVNTQEAAWARCHWCRQVLTLENQMANGAVPDMLLPFSLTKEQARQSIEKFAKKRWFYAFAQFKREFTTENILGVYLPYMVVDANLHCDIRGKAGDVVRSYNVGVGDSKKTVYDIDMYDIGRDFDLAIDNLTVEASQDKLNVNNNVNTNNIINTILPFDIENAIAYNGNYLKGFNSERRDTNIDALRGLVTAQINDVTRNAANLTANKYDGGIKWESQDMSVVGMQWLSAYLPVWLYSYMQVKGDGSKLLHYIAVNGRTGETMGSVPVSMGRLFGVSAVIELIALAIVVFVIWLLGPYVFLIS